MRLPQGVAMKKGIHPKYTTCTVKCACGNTFQTRATVEELKVDICNVCHPYYTGKQKFVDTAGRVQRFRQRYGDYKGKKAQQQA
jgi:large subunit ribosomal protein L31